MTLHRVIRLLAMVGVVLSQPTPVVGASDPAPTTVSASPIAYPTLDGGTHPASELLALLMSSGGAHLTDVTITGTLRLPTSLVLLTGDGVAFDGPVIATGLTKLDTIQFDDTVFAETVRVDNDVIGTADFRQSRFEQPVEFTYTSFGSLELNNSVFESPVDFSYSSIAVSGTPTGCECLNLFDVRFFGYGDFTSVSVQDVNTTQMYASAPLNIDWATVQTSFAAFRSWVNYGTGPERVRRASIYEAQLRFWKSNFVAIGRPRDALEVNRELILANQDFSLDPGRGEWWFVWILAWPTDFGTQPLRVIGIALLVVAIFAIGFYRTGAIQTSDGRKPTSRFERSAIALAYSVGSFVPVVQILDKDSWTWTAKGGLAWLPGIERALGWLTLALAAYSVGSYIL